MQSALTQVSAQRAFFGNALNQINPSENYLNQDKVNLSSEANALIGADAAAAASQLSQAQTAYQVELQPQRVYWTCRRCRISFSKFIRDLDSTERVY
ncbi:MAG TPA: flagellin [Candidatus Limnocylindrales bacterium]|nr:flagellin [Candidatus Limnocylindrales bacterium]